MKIEELHWSVVEVEKLIVRILDRIQEVEKALSSLTAAHAIVVKDHHDLKLQCEARFVALQKDVGELRRWSEKNGTLEIKLQLEVLKEKVAKIEATLEKIGTRAWSLMPNVAGSIVNVLLAATVAFIVAKLTK